MARSVFHFVILLFAVTSLVSAQGSGFCADHGASCNSCLEANTLSDKPAAAVCVWCNDPVVSGNRCQTIIQGNNIQDSCRHLNFNITCSISFLAALIIGIVVVILFIACCCCICCCLIALCVRAANSNRRSQVTYKEFA